MNQSLVIFLISLLSISCILTFFTWKYSKERQYLPSIEWIVLYWACVLTILSLVVKTAIMYFSSLSIN